MGNVAVSLDDSLSLGLSTVVDSGVLSSHSEMTEQVKASIPYIKNVYTVHTIDEFYLLRDNLVLMWHSYSFFSSFLAICLRSVCVCGDSLGSSRMDPSSHPSVPKEINSTALTHRMAVLKKMPKWVFMINLKILYKEMKYNDENIF